MRKLASLATAMAILALGLPMQASAETTAKPMVKTEAAKVATVHGADHFFSGAHTDLAHAVDQALR